MPWKEVKPVMLECNPVELCSRPYPGHKKGCPNIGTRGTCPPQAQVWDLDKVDATFFAIWNAFDFRRHTARMRSLHPGWSKRQVECCLYWQKGARSKLEREIMEFHKQYPSDMYSAGVSRTPEGHGVNVTMTMASLGILLEWPPKDVTYQIAIAIVQERKASIDDDVIRYALHEEAKRKAKR